MGYDLNALISTEAALTPIVERFAYAFLNRLDQNFALIPVIPELFDEINEQHREEAKQPNPFPDHFWFLSASLTNIANEISAISPIAYIESDYFGGQGGQAAVVWDQEKVVLGPIAMNYKNFKGTGLPKTPISQALQALSVRNDKYYDEFDAIGLGKIRHTEDRVPRDENGNVQI